MISTRLCRASVIAACVSLALTCSRADAQGGLGSLGFYFPVVGGGSSTQLNVGVGPRDFTGDGTANDYADIHQNGTIRFNFGSGQLSRTYSIPPSSPFLPTAWAAQFDGVAGEELLLWQPHTDGKFHLIRTRASLPQTLQGPLNGDGWVGAVQVNETVAAEIVVAWTSVNDWRLQIFDNQSGIGRNYFPWRNATAPQSLWKKPTTLYAQQMDGYGGLDLWAFYGRMSAPGHVLDRAFPIHLIDDSRRWKSEYWFPSTVLQIYNQPPFAHEYPAGVQQLIGYTGDNHAYYINYWYDLNGHHLGAVVPGGTRLWY